MCHANFDGLLDKCLDTADIQAEVIRHNNTITTISNSHLTNMVRFRNNNTGVRCIKDSKVRFPVNDYLRCFH